MSLGFDWLATAALCLLASGSPLLAQQPAVPNPTNPPPALQLKVNREFIPGAGPVARGELLTRSNRLAFLFPPDTVARADAAKERVTFVARDDSYSLALQFREGQKPAASTDALRDQLRAQHPELRELAAFTCHSLGTNGPGLDFVWQTTGGVRVFSRAAQIPLPGGHVELLMLSDSAQFEASKHRFNSLLLTLRRGGLDERVEAPVVVPD